ncbi:hypothetical protein [Micromonospora craniellae]|uniref:hypothetical protein n=1 Tax=Micromonospora craniellae TaxID=2294034 RepID=UPI000E3DB0F0|nr:hypothetical protein [Micromonospora craniellae]QOC90424.1 hypothetical protein ID554_19850 [Micromonospora craniellae]
MPHPPSPRKPETTRQGTRQSPQQASHELKIEELRLKYQLYAKINDSGRVVLWILSSAIPLLVIAQIAEQIAGKETNLTASLSVTISIAIVFSAGWAITARRSHERKREIDRLRSRNDGLERILTQLRLEIAGSSQQPEPA